MSRLLPVKKLLRPKGRALLGTAPVTPPWVVNPTNAPDTFLDFANDRAWKKSGGIITPVSSLLTVARSSTKYVNDSTGTWSSVSANVLARSDLGALVEEGRTNSIRNNSNGGAVIGVLGSGGLLPTNWAIGGVTTGLTFAVVATGTESGIDYVDVRISGTAGASVSPTIIFDGNSGGVAAAANGQTWASSMFARLVAGSFANFGFWVGQVSFRDASSASLQVFPGSDAIASMVSAQNIGSNRPFSIATASNASTAFVRNQFQSSIANGLTVDATIRFGWPQLELGASVTSPIRTTSAAVARNADVVTVTSPGAFGTAYTVYAAGTPSVPTSYGNNQMPFCLSDGATSNRALVQRTTGTGIPTLRTVSGGSAAPNLAGGVAWAQSTSGKCAATFAASDDALVFNGGAPSTASNTLPVGVNSINIGTNSLSDQNWNGFLTGVGYWLSQRVPNAQLQSMTA